MSYTTVTRFGPRPSPIHQSSTVSLTYLTNWSLSLVQALCSEPQDHRPEIGDEQSRQPPEEKRLGLPRGTIPLDEGGVAKAHDDQRQTKNQGHDRVAAQASFGRRRLHALIEPDSYRV